MRRHARKKRQWLWRVLGVGLLLIIGIGGLWAYRIAASFSGSKGLTEVWTGITNPRGLFPGKDRIIILIAGKDYNHDRKGMPYSSDARADTIMLLSADLDGEKLGAVSIPRDTKSRDLLGREQKINASLQRGGIEGLRQTIYQEFGVMPDYYVLLKDTAVKEIVDAVGGVEVEAIDDMFYQDSWGGLYIDIEKGRHRLTGQEAIGFVRFRKSGTHRFDENGRRRPVRYKSSLEEGDIRRAERQQMVLRALGQEAMRPANLMKADKIIDIAFNQFETDLSRSQILALATIFKDRGTSGMANAVIPGSDAMEGGIYYWIPDLERTPLVLDWVLYGNEYSGRKLVRISVLNSTEFNGAARVIAEDLTEMGYTAASGGNSKEMPEKTEVLFRKAAFEEAALKIADRIGAKVVKKDEVDPRADWLPEIKVILAADVAEEAVKPKETAATASESSARG